MPVDDSCVISLEGAREGGRRRRRRGRERRMEEALPIIYICVHVC